MTALQWDKFFTFFVIKGIWTKLESLWDALKKSISVPHLVDSWSMMLVLENPQKYMWKEAEVDAAEQPYII